MEEDLPSRFLKKEFLGMGMGTVWVARDLEKGSTVVVKALSRLKYLAHGLAFPPLEASLSLCHPNIVSVLDVMIEVDRVYLVQEHAPGGDLFASMQDAGIFTEFAARCCFSDILAGVTFIHAHGIVHRDLKPENCVLDRLGTVKIIDFGLATKFTPGQLLKEFCGSPEYAAPEMVRRLAHEGPPLDVWAMGVILYDMVMGQLPFDREVEEFALPDAFGADLSSELAALLTGLLKENPVKRIATAAVASSEWMQLPVGLGSNSSIDLVSKSCSHRAGSVAEVVLPDASPLRHRIALERSNALAIHMGLFEAVTVKRK